MPHFVIECSSDVIMEEKPETIMQVVYDTAEATGLFAPNDIKVRLHPYRYYQLGEDKNDFVHVFAYIMQGRTTEQKAELSKRITTRLNELLPDIEILSINITDFESATYCNKSLIHPMNTGNDRHFLL